MVDRTAVLPGRHRPSHQRARTRAGHRMSFSVLQAAREQPGRDALIIDVNAWSYQELAARVAAEMESLPALLGAAGSRVALVARPEVEALVSLLALIELRHPVVLLHPRSTEAEHAALLEAAPAARVLASVSDVRGVVRSRGDQGGRGDQG